VTFDPSTLLHVSHSVAVELARQLNGTTSNADLLSRAGISGPVAIEIARQMSVGAGDVGKLHMFGFSVDDAKTLAGAITAAGAR
jgi:hypothetical protein